MMRLIRAGLNGIAIAAGLLAIGFGITCLSAESRGLARWCDRMELRILAAWAGWRARRNSRRGQP